MTENTLELWNEFSNLEIDDSGKIKKVRRLHKILRELAKSEAEEDIALIAKIASKYVSKGEQGKKTGFSVSHPLNKGDVYNALYMDSILETLYEANSKLKNETLHRLGNEQVEFINYRIKTAPRLFSPEEVFEKFGEDVIDYYLQTDLEKGYGVYNKKLENDSQKTWDKRWAKFFLDRESRYSCLHFLYDTDVASWSRLLASCKIPEFEGSGLTNREFRQDCRWFGEVLQKAYKNNHPEKEVYYKDFLKQGFPKDLLDKYIS